MGLPYIYLRILWKILIWQLTAKPPNAKFSSYMVLITTYTYKYKNKSKGEVGMAVRKSIQARVVGIIRYILHPYYFSSDGISLKSSEDVRCTL